MKVNQKERSAIAEKFEALFASYGFRNDAPYERPIKYMLEMMEEEGRLFYYERLNYALNNKNTTLQDLLNDIELTKEEAREYEAEQIDEMMLKSLCIIRDVVAILT